MNYTKEVNKLDEVVEQHGVKIVVDSKAVMFIVGTKMDFVEDDLKSEFLFINPNSKVRKCLKQGGLWLWGKFQRLVRYLMNLD